jgi:CheY-like chemotaxis protein
VKFTPAGGSITVDVIEDAAHVSVRVRDTGIGIDAAFLPHVFERFEQADSSSTRSHGGLGLGLSIVRHLVELHGGTVSAASEGRDRGATFEVVLPLQPDAARGVGRQTGRHGRFAAPPSLVEKRVLVVEDDEDSRDLVGEILSTAGASVSLAESAAAAIALFGSGGFDVVVTDIAMPGADGYALLADLQRIAQERGLGLRAVALTAYGRAEDRAAAERAGFRAHVSKPVEPDQLVATVARVLETT